MIYESKYIALDGFEKYVRQHDLGRGWQHVSSQLVAKAEIGHYVAEVTFEHVLAKCVFKRTCELIEDEDGWDLQGA